MSYKMLFVVAIIGVTIGHSDPPKPTADKIAEQTQVSPKTVKRAEKFAEAVDKVAENTGINPQKILSGEVKATLKEIKEVAETKSRASSLPLKTAEKIAQQNHVSHQTIKNAEKFSEAVDKVTENIGVSPQEILSGRISASRKDIKKYRS